jgi:hypothetical protein
MPKKKKTGLHPGGSVPRRFVRTPRPIGGTKPRPKPVPRGTKTGPAVKGEMSPRPRGIFQVPIRPKRPQPRYPGPTPRPKPPRPTRPPTRRPSTRLTGSMDAIRRRFNQANRRSLGRFNFNQGNRNYTYSDGGLTKSTTELSTGLKKAKDSK